MNAGRATASWFDAVANGFWLSSQGLREWQAAFVGTFGMTPAAFYADFRATP